MIPVNQLLRYMPRVAHYDTVLSSLGVWWQKISLIGKINSLSVAATLLDDMESTRRRFEALQSELIEQLAQQHLRKLEQEIGARAQVAIDILIRNLFERTADVGFLATDDDIRTFLADPEPDAAEIEAMVGRLREYTLKYSVYDEIVLLDTDGTVRAHLDEGNPIKRCQDPLIRATAETRAPYLETFGHSDLQPGRRRSLIYSAPVTAADGGRVLGVLCLCFRFEDEMAGIFANLARDGECIAILDQHGSVIASSDENRLALGAPVAAGQALGLVNHGGEACLGRSALTKGYQGYMGLAWQGYAMCAAASAFGASGQQDEVRLNDSRLFTSALRQIRHTAAEVTDDLSLVVLNGMIVSAKRDANEFIPVLYEIRNIGLSTRKVFDESIANLQSTVVAALLGELRFQAFLAVDIMDRNLYERANDVRWWALTSRFREILARGEMDEVGRATLTSILEYVNSLYTVYSNLLLFDTTGTVLAVSNPREQHWVDRSLPPETHFAAALGISSSQQYVVSPFCTTALYGERPTYIYLTAVHAPGSDAVVAGIGIVFDAAPQFAAMLADTLPRDVSGVVLDGAFGVFAEPGGRVIASTRTDLPPGASVDIDRRFAGLANGQRDSAIVEYRGVHYAVGAARSQGYREYKTTGDYSNDVLALIFVPL